MNISRWWVKESLVAIRALLLNRDKELAMPATRFSLPRLGRGRGPLLLVSLRYRGHTIAIILVRALDQRAMPANIEHGIPIQFPRPIATFGLTF